MEMSVEDLVLDFATINDNLDEGHADINEHEEAKQVAKQIASANDNISF